MEGEKNKRILVLHSGLFSKKDFAQAPNQMNTCIILLHWQINQARKTWILV